MSATADQNKTEATVEDKALEDKALKHFRREFSRKFNETKTSKRIGIAVLGLLAVGAALVVAPPLLLGGVVAGLKLGGGYMLAGWAAAVASFIPMTADLLLRKKFVDGEMDKAKAEGSLVARYKAALDAKSSAVPDMTPATIANEAGSLRAAFENKDGTRTADAPAQAPATVMRPRNPA